MARNRPREPDDDDDFEVVDDPPKRKKPVRQDHDFEVVDDDFEVVEDEPKRKRRPVVDEDEDDEEEEERPRKKKKKQKRIELGPMDKTYRDTNMAVLVLFGICCSFIALIHSTVGVITSRDQQAKSNATIVMVVSFISFAVNITLRIVLKG